MKNFALFTLYLIFPEMNEILNWYNWGKAKSAERKQETEDLQVRYHLKINVVVL